MFLNQWVTAIYSQPDEYEKYLPASSRSDHLIVDFVPCPIYAFTATQPLDYIFRRNTINHVRYVQAGFSKLCSVSTQQGKVIVSIDAHNNQL